MSQYNSANLKTVGEESSMNDSDEDSDFTDTMSRLTMEDEDDVKDGEDDLSYDTGTMVSNQSDYQSNASKHGHSPTARARKSRRSSAKYEDKWYGTTSIGLPYVIDLWKNKTPQNVIGVQVWMMSGSDMYKSAKVRISTDKRSVVLETFYPTMPLKPRWLLTAILSEIRVGGSQMRPSYLKQFWIFIPKQLPARIALRSFASESLERNRLF